MNTNHQGDLQEGLKQLDEITHNQILKANQSGEKLKKILSELKSEKETAQRRLELISTLFSFFDVFIAYLKREEDKKIKSIEKECQQFINEVKANLLKIDEEKATIQNAIDFLNESVKKLLGSLPNIPAEETFVLSQENIIQQLAEKVYHTPEGPTTLFDEIMVLEHKEVAASQEGNNNIRLIHVIAKKVALVAEDCPDTSQLLRHLLEREGLQVIMVNSGIDVEKITKELSLPPDIILMNNKLPPLEGKDLIKLLHNMEGWSKVPVLVLTSNYLEQEVVELLGAGANDCLHKPFNPKELIARVKRYLGVDDDAD